MATCIKKAAPVGSGFCLFPVSRSFYFLRGGLLPPLSPDLSPDLLPWRGGRLPPLGPAGPTLRFFAGAGLESPESLRQVASSVRPATRISRNCLNSSFGMPSGRSTVLWSSMIWILPINSESRPISLAIAPTILPGFTSCVSPTSIR